MANFPEQLVCDANALIDSGKGVRFSVLDHGEMAAAFVIRYRGVVYGYLNRCRHVPAELDWQDGRFFDHEGQYLICSLHGALYSPDSGHCVAGPCRGQSLQPLTMHERDGRIYYLPQASASARVAANV